MVNGFIDHWCPTLAKNASLWCSSYDEVESQLEGMIRDVKMDELTFYTKWYTNGIYTRLKYLKNHISSSNVITKNDWGRQIIKYLHSHGISAGFMLQLLVFEKNTWGQGYSLMKDGAPDLDISFIGDTDSKIIIADFTTREYMLRAEEIIEEHLDEFPDVDFLYLEFEGMITHRSIFRSLLEKFTGSPQVTFDIDVLDLCNEVMLDIDATWSKEAAELYNTYFGELFRRIGKLLERKGYKGGTGIVFYAWGYESLIFPKILPTMDWWLVPWDYAENEVRDHKLYTGGNRFVIPWEDHEYNGTPSGVCLRRIDAAKRNVAEWKKQGYKVGFLGDATIRKGTSDIIRDMYDFCAGENLEGYLAMGNPFCSRGLRWVDITDEDAAAAAKLYRCLYNDRKDGLR
jgi:hypothetical protein